jgi:hypothetical protein
MNELTQTEIIEANRMRQELERDTPLGELLDDLDQGVSDSFNPISGEMD